MVEFLDFDQAAYYLETIERKIKFDNLLVDDAARFRMWLLFVKVSILRQDIPKRLKSARIWKNPSCRKGRGVCI